jgi:hypothetical protein
MHARVHTHPIAIRHARKNNNTTHLFDVGQRGIVVVSQASRLDELLARLLLCTVRHVEAMATRVQRQSTGARKRTLTDASVARYTPNNRILSSALRNTASPKTAPTNVSFCIRDHGR